MDQAFYINDINSDAVKSTTTFEGFRSLRTKLVYVAFSTCPDVLVFIAHLAQYTETRFRKEKEEALRILRKAWKVIRNPPSIAGLMFVPLDVENTEIVVCIDAAFAVNKDFSSQLGTV